MYINNIILFIVSGSNRYMLYKYMYYINEKKIFSIRKNVIFLIFIITVNFWLLVITVFFGSVQEQLSEIKWNLVQYYLFCFY